MRRSKRRPYQRRIDGKEECIYNEIDIGFLERYRRKSTDDGCKPS